MNDKDMSMLKDAFSKTNNKIEYANTRINDIEKEIGQWLDDEKKRKQKEKKEISEVNNRLKTFKEIDDAMLNLQSDLKAKQEVLAKINVDALFKEFEEEAKPSLNVRYEKTLAYMDSLQNNAKIKSEEYDARMLNLNNWVNNSTKKFRQSANESLEAIHSIKQQVEKNEIKIQSNPIVNEQEIKTVKTKPSKESSVKKDKFVDPGEQPNEEEAIDSE